MNPLLRVILLILFFGFLAATTDSIAQAPTNGLVAYYPFNGNANDESGSNYNGTVSGASLTADRNGQSSKAYTFNGSQSIDLGTIVQLTTNTSFSISLWVKVASSATLSRAVISTAKTNANFYMSVLNTGKVFFGYGTGSSLAGFTGNKIITDDTWHHVTLTYDLSTVKIYIDGTLDASRPNTNIYKQFGRTFVGSHPTSLTGLSPMTGSLDDIRVYNRTLSDSEIQQIYQAEKPAGIDLNMGLVAYYPFNGNANDESGNGNHGTPQNGLTFGADRFGNAGKAANFDGVDDYIQAESSPSLNIQNAISISAWVKTKNASLSQRIVDKTTVSGADAYMIDFRPSQQIRFIVANAVYNQPQSNPVFTENNIWVNVTVTYDKTNAKFYKNGILDKVIPLTGETVNNNNPLRLGANSLLNGDWFNGSLDDIRIYNRALSDTEIQQLYEIEDLDTFIARSKLAKKTYLSLLSDSDVTQAVNYPVPFLDLQNSFSSDTTYYKYAKTLSYLEYGDGRAPFDRNLLRFNPTDSITRALVLKVLLEAWNIDETTATGDSPYGDVPISHPYYNYIKKAYDLGIIEEPGGLFRPDVACSIGEANNMLSNLTGNTSIIKPTLAQINAGFFVPGQYRPDNLSVGVGTDRGNFNHYTKTSFAIDGVVPLVFAHSYNSYATELPNELYPNFMGRGWTHSFNCYITATGSVGNERFVVHYPDGKLHFYKVVAGALVPESIGVYDQVTVSGSPVNLVTITTPSKIVYQFEKLDGQSGDFWLVKSIKDRNNNTLSFTNELGINNYARLKSVSDPAGRTLNFVYQTGEPRNYLVEVNLGGVGSFNGRKIQFNYSTSAWDVDGIKDLISYKEYDKNGALKTTSYTYYTLEGSEHLLKTITLPKGNVIDNTYEQRKLRSSRTLNGSTVVQQMNTNWSHTYSASSQGSTSAVSVTAGAVTKTTNYTQNDNGLTTRLQTTGSNPMDLKMDYRLGTDPTSVTRIIQNEGTSSSTGVRIEYYPTAPYNVKLVKTAKAAGDSITQSYVYNSFNDIESFINGRGFTTSFEYNGTGNLTRINHPIGSPTLMSRDSKGLITQTTTPANVVTNFTYNTYGNLLSTSTANGTNPAITTSATYDALSRVVSKTDARSQTVTYDYFANDLLKKMNAPLSYYVSYDYDANDNNTTVTNAKGNATTNVYNIQTDQLMSRSFGGKTESFTYYEDGSLKTFTNGRGNVFNFTYDPSGRLTNDGYSAYAFNEDGTLNTVTHTQGSKTYILDYDYDRLKRLNKTICDGFAVQYRYDNNNNLDLLTYPDGKTVTYAYDAKDRITSVTDWAGRITTYTYDDDGKVKSYALPNTTKATYTYDAAGRPTGISHQKSTNAILSSYNFVLDQGGNHLEENVIEPFTSLPTLVAGTTNYTTNARNETTAAGSNTYTFDANGAITNQAGQAITWDSKDNLLTRNGITYYYDGNETRRAKTGKKYVINELSNSVLAETNEAGGYLYYYVYGPTGLLYRQNASNGAVEYYHYDFRGSTVAMTDANQNIVRQYQYDPYGKVLQQTPQATSDDNPFRYVGQYGVQYEADNLYFMRARYYDPTTGKFLSEDPVWSTNLYAYVGNNPVLGIDPSGLYVTDVTTCASAYGGIGGGICITARTDGQKSAIYLTPEAGMGLAVNASVQICTYPNANSISDVEESKLQANISAEMDIAGVGTSINVNPNLKKDGGTDVEIGVGPISSNIATQGTKGTTLKVCTNVGVGGGAKASVSKEIKVGESKASTITNVISYGPGSINNSISTNTMIKENSSMTTSTTLSPPTNQVKPITVGNGIVGTIIIYR